MPPPDADPNLFDPDPTLPPPPTPFSIPEDANFDVPPPELRGIRRFSGSTYLGDVSISNAGIFRPQWIVRVTQPFENTPYSGETVTEFTFDGREFTGGTAANYFVEDGGVAKRPLLALPVTLEDVIAAVEGEMDLRAARSK